MKKFIEGVASRDSCASLDTICTFDDKRLFIRSFGEFCYYPIRNERNLLLIEKLHSKKGILRIEQLQFRQRKDREKSISYETELWFYYTEKSTGAFFDK